MGAPPGILNNNTINNNGPVDNIVNEEVPIDNVENGQEVEEDEGPIMGPMIPRYDTESSGGYMEYPVPPPPEEERNNINFKKKIEIDDEERMLVPISLRVKRENTTKQQTKRAAEPVPSLPKEKDEEYDVFMKDMKELGVL
jgi:hypothetical protein